MHELVQVFLCVWVMFLTVELYLFNRIINKHEELLYLLRDRINSLESKRGHIFCKTVDKDFGCKKISEEDMNNG